ncbi:VWA domain-containing protein [Campylobacter sp.]|uniref:VWA domain-containing protein n=1 Tax=Campylobacter sp. TaxID=205 RepID=UPI002703C752|nr:VWA domain-containing protein [Campylobacter sp.]
MNLTGLNDANLAVTLCAIEPNLSGVLLVGSSGVGKSFLISQIKRWYDKPIVFVPVGVEYEQLDDSLCFEDMIKGRDRLNLGLISRARGGMLVCENCSFLSNEVLKRITSENLSLVLTHNLSNPSLNENLLDRIDLCVNIETQTNLSGREEIVKNSLNFSEISGELYAQSFKNAKRNLNFVSYGEDELKICIDMAAKANSLGHRAERAILLAARAYAALMGDEKISKYHIEKVAPFCLLHRQTDPVSSPQNSDESKPQESAKDSKNESKPKNEESLKQNEADMSFEPAKDDDQNSSDTKEGGGKEEVIRADKTLNIRNLILKKDQKSRTFLGLRTATKTTKKVGRTVKTAKKSSDDISICATIRAAAPWQRLRKRKEHECLKIEQEDIRVKQRQAKSSYTIIIVVDASGSMGANARIKHAKEICFGILKDAYVKRENVAVVAFRQNLAQAIILPTRAKALIKDRLDSLPVGGKTPLSAALKQMYALSKNIMKKEPERRILGIIISDARANLAMDKESKIWDEVAKWSQVIRDEDNITTIVVDTEVKSFVSFDKAKQLATLLNASYYDLSSFEKGV